MGNRLKDALAAQQMQIGLWLNLGDASAAEIAGQAGYDWCLIDGEHGPYNPTAILGQLRALAPFGVEPVVRVPIGEDWVIKQVMDLGVRSLLVPMVDTPQQAAHLVRATRYAPEGHRGMGSAVARVSGYGADTGYVDRANSEACLLLQAETRMALDNIDAIAAVDGVDCLWVGHFDLSVSLGVPGDFAHPTFTAAMDRIVGAAKKHNKSLGRLVPNVQQGIDFNAEGFDFICYSGDVWVLHDALAEAIGKLRDGCK